MGEIFLFGIIAILVPFSFTGNEILASDNQNPFIWVYCPNPVTIKIITLELLTNHMLQ